jgi:phosphopantothenoylcysteine decarboxylase/phosphopantothenate--cysteine ligase
VRAHSPAAARRRVRHLCADEGRGAVRHADDAGALSENEVHTSLWDLKNEVEMGHIQLSRQADLLVVCPATADLLARMAAGIADDLATTLLLATDKPVLAVPAMNVRMWQHPATVRNVAQLRRDGIRVIEPDEGDMACGEYGPGRLPEPAAIAAAIGDALAAGTGPSLAGKHVLVTAGPTHEPIDPVRVLANRSSGKQGFAIAACPAGAGCARHADCRPGRLAHAGRRPPRRCRDRAGDAGRACRRPSGRRRDYGRGGGRLAGSPLARQDQKGWRRPACPALVENPDLLAELASSPARPRLLIGFAAETDNLLAHARAKLARKGCDWIVANDVSGDVMGGDANAVHLLTASGVESWERLSKAEVARRLAARIAAALGDDGDAQTNG